MSITPKDIGEIQSRLTNEGLPDVLEIRGQEVLRSNPNAFDGITPSNARLRLRDRFGINIPKRRGADQAAYSLTMMMGKGIGRSMG